MDGHSFDGSWEGRPAPHLVGLLESRLRGLGALLDCFTPRPFQIDHTHVGIVVVYQEVRQFVARPRLVDCVRGVGVQANLDADAEAVVASQSPIERTMRNAARDAQVSRAVSRLLPVSLQSRWRPQLRASSLYSSICDALYPDTF